MPARPADQLRPVTIEPFETAAAGSVIISAGRTRVLCTASVAEDAPAWIKRDADGVPVKGWVTAEYAMMPGSTPERQRRREDGRSTEIRRLIGRALRAAVDMEQMPGLAIMCDCDVLLADGGTRTASITGAWVALAQALDAANAAGRLPEGAKPLRGRVAAVSVGIVDGSPVLDLDYPLDSRAEVDMNVVMNDRGGFIEVQGTGEAGTFTRGELDALLDLAEGGIAELFEVQAEAVGRLSGL